MTIAGALFLGVSLTFVWGLTIFCYRRVLATPLALEDPDDPDQPEPNAAQE